MGRELSALASYMLPLATRLLDDAAAAGIELLVIDTDRTEVEQAVKLSQKVSWTTHSKHEPQPPEDKSEALDVCPKVLLGTKYWSPDSPLWNRVGEIGKRLGLHWGGDWLEHRDPGHFEYVHRAPVVAA